jgi:riboflavin synthase
MMPPIIHALFLIDIPPTGGDNQSVMFTGIIEKRTTVLGAADGPMFRRLTIRGDWTDVAAGESIAVNGCCLTVAEIQPGQLGFDVIQETLNKTNLRLLQGGDEINVERSLRVGDRIDGHFVQGHVDGTGPLVELLTTDREYRLRIAAPDHLVKYLAPKGSIAIDGVSLTIARVEGNEFEIALIPTTLNLTTLGGRQPGWLFNLEADILSKTIVHYLEQQRK